VTIGKRKERIRREKKEREREELGETIITRSLIKEINST
jgi:hypothetical protein